MSSEVDIFSDVSGLHEWGKLPLGLNPAKTTEVLLSMDSTLARQQHNDTTMILHGIIRNMGASL